MSTPTVIGFGARLRAERERRKITLLSIAENTKISMSLLAALERDDFSRWPSGIFRRSFMRAYAEAIGVDVDTTVAEFLERFPDPEEPAAAGPPADRPLRLASVAGVKGLRLTMADRGAAFTRGRLIPNVLRRWAAAGCDAGVVFGLSALLFLAVGRFWMPFGVTMLGYYIGGILLLGNTPGVSLFAAEEREPEPEVSARRA